MRFIIYTDLAAALAGAEPISKPCVASVAIVEIRQNEMPSGVRNLSRLVSRIIVTTDSSLQQQQEMRYLLSVLS